jgi:hypothetical protein
MRDQDASTCVCTRTQTHLCMVLDLTAASNAIRVEREKRHGSMPSLLHIVECRRDAEGHGISADCPGGGIRLCPARGAQHIYKWNARRCGAAGGPQYCACHQDSCQVSQRMYVLAVTEVCGPIRSCVSLCFSQICATTSYCVGE